GKRRRAVRDVVGPADAAGRGERAPVLPCRRGRAPFQPPEQHRRRRRDRRAVSRAHGVIRQRGTVALALAAGALAGPLISPGARVDVLAVPLLGRAPAGRTTVLLAQSALVLDVRAETGAPYGATAGKTGLVTAERIGSVVVAIAPNEELRFADRIATSTFVLAAISAGVWPWL